MYNLHISLTDFKNETRVLKEIKSLSDYRITKITAVYALYSDGLEKYIKLSEDAHLYRIKLITKKLPSSIVVQLLKYFEFFFRILILTKSKPPDVVNIHALSLLPIGAMIKFLYGSKLIYDAHELETETFVLSGFRKRCAKIIEYIYINYVDLVIVVSEGIKDWYLNSYDIKNVVVIKNSPLYNKSIKNSKILHDELGIAHEKKILIYLGGLVSGRGIEDLLMAAKEFSNSDYAFIFMGYGHLDYMIRDFSNLYEHIFLMPAVSPDLVLEYTASANVGIAFIENGSLNDKYCLPNKLFEYIFSGLPVIINNAPEMFNIINKYNIGIVIDNLNGKSLKFALDCLSRFDKITLSENIDNAKIALSWNVQEKILIKAYKKYIV